MKHQESCVILSTHPEIQGAEDLASQLVQNQLVACVNIVPKLTSVYLWQGQVEKDQECLLIIKTSNLKKEKVQEFIVEQHPYEVPEVIELPLQGGFEPYLAWVSSVTG